MTQSDWATLGQHDQKQHEFQQKHLQSRHSSEIALTAVLYPCKNSSSIELIFAYLSVVEEKIPVCGLVGVIANKKEMQKYMKFANIVNEC